jgi:hypothetical protein
MDLFGRSFLDGSGGNNTNVYLWNMRIGHTTISTDKELTKGHGRHLEKAIEALNQDGARCSLAGTASKDGSLQANTRVCNQRVADLLMFLVRKSNAVITQFRIKDPIIQPGTNTDDPGLWRGVRMRITTDRFLSVSTGDPTAPQALDMT